MRLMLRNPDGAITAGQKKSSTPISPDEVKEVKVEGSISLGVAGRTYDRTPLTGNSPGVALQGAQGHRVTPSQPLWTALKGCLRRVYHGGEGRARRMRHPGIGSY
jgi:hypothetical protein